MPAPSPSPAISPVRCPILVSASSVRLTLPCDALPSRLTQAMIAQASRSSSIPNSSSNVMGSYLVLADKASTTLIRPMKFGDDKSKAPASFLFLAGAWLILEPFRLDSTSAASDSHTFSRNRRRDGRDDAYRAYRYDVFQITLRHLYLMSSPQT